MEEENDERYVGVYDALEESIRDKKRIYNMKPNKTALFTVNGFFNNPIKMTKSKHTKYAHVLCHFHECDGVKMNGQTFYLQVSLMNGYSQLVNLLEQHKDKYSLTIKLTRVGKVIYYYDIMDIDRDIDSDTYRDMYIDSELGVRKGV